MLSVFLKPRTLQPCVQLCNPLRRSPNKQQCARLLGRNSRGRLEPVGPSVPGTGSAPIAKPLIFTGVVGVTCFLGASIWQYEEMRSRMAAKANLMSPFQYHHRHAKTGSFRQHINVWWNSLSQGQKIFMPILGCNVAVFIAWRVPRLRNTMLNYFSADPTQKSVCWPMLLSTFSHYSALHLAANMYVLHSFSSGAVNLLGKEQFLGLYIGAGVFSSLTSHFYKIVTKCPGRSLGASGAIMGILAYVCTQVPNTRLSIIFLPDLNFSAQQAITGLVLLDLLGVLFRWKFFDHAAHLGGACLGIAYATWGHGLWMKREPFITWWHENRSSMFKDK